jgi:PAS domain S-box-containing protein
MPCITVIWRGASGEFRRNDRKDGLMERKRVQDADRRLGESEHALLWNSYAKSRIPTMTIDGSGKIVDINQAMVDLIGYTHEEVPDLQTLISLIFLDETYRRKIIESRDKYMNTGNFAAQDYYIITDKKGDERHVIFSAYNIVSQNESVDLLVIQAVDITEQKRIERALNESELKYRSLFKSMGQGFYVAQILYDGSGIPCDFRYLDTNSAFEKMVGLDRKQLIGKTYNELVPPDPASGWPECFKRVATTGRPEIYLFSSEVYKTHFETYAFRPEEGKFAALVKDVTDRTRMEEKINNLLKEKELILKEVHHRIKNNMSVICGLLELQAGTQRDAASQGALQDAAHRIQSMQVLYDKLYRSENITALSIRDYLPSLIEEVVKQFENSEAVSVETVLDDIVLDSKLLSSIGIIINELVTNAMKYAFKDRSGGKLIATASGKGDRVALTFEDDGIGLPESVTTENSTGFGMQLIGMMIQQMRGTIDVSRRNGTKFTIEFEA